MLNITESEVIIMTGHNRKQTVKLSRADYPHFKEADISYYFSFDMI